MEKLIYILNILAILGFPSLFAVVTISVRRIKILMKAQQEQMRSQLLKDFYTYKNRGFVYEAELQDWIECYEAYHKLGANGVMDARKAALLTFETKQEI